MNILIHGSNVFQVGIIVYKVRKLLVRVRVRVTNSTPFNPLIIRVFP